MAERFVPRGDLWWAYLDPVVGREQGGRRPVLVVSDSDYNATAVGRVIIVPITTKKRDYATFVPLQSPALAEQSWAIVDQIRAIDASRLRRRIGAATAESMSEVERILRFVLSL